MRPKWPGRLAALLTCAAVAFALARAFRPLPAAVDVARVVRGDVRVTVDEEGRTRIRERFVVASPLAGRLRRITFHAGDHVTRGSTVLAVVEPALPALVDARERARLAAHVDVARAALDATEPALERAVLAQDHATRELARVRRLHAGAAAQAFELDSAEQVARLAAEDVRAARHAQRVAEFELALAETELAVATPDEGRAPGNPPPFEIRAPIDGAVLRVVQESASTVAAGAPLVELGDPADLEVVVDVLTQDAVRIAPGADAELVRWGGSAPLAARVRLVEPEAFTKVSALGVEEQRVTVVLDLLDPPAARARLGDGYRVEARILVDAGRGVALVPSGALFRVGGSWAAYRISGTTVELRTVEAGRSDGRSTEVLAGLADGDRVVLHPGSDVAPGVAVAERGADAR